MELDKHKAEVVESYPLVPTPFGVSNERQVHAECTCGWRSTQHGYGLCPTLCPCTEKVKDEGYKHYDLIKEADSWNEAFRADPHRGEKLSIGIEQ